MNCKLVIDGDHMYFKEFIDVLTDNGYSVMLTKISTLSVDEKGIETPKQEYELFIQD